MRIHPRVTQISTKFRELPVELYFIKGERNAIIDTGSTQSPKEDIAPALNSLGLGLADIDLILNTHGHHDHTAGNAAVKAAGNAQILVHREDVILLEDHKQAFLRYYRPMIEAMRRQDRLDEEWSIFLGKQGPEIAVDQQLEDNDVIDLGDGVELRVIHLPGHSLGCVGFYWEREGLLISGDSLPGGSDGGMLPMICDPSGYERSLQRLLQMPIRLLLCAHPYQGLTLSPSPIRRGEEVRQYLQDSQEVIERTREAVGRVVRHVDKPLSEIVDEVVMQLPEEMRFKPIREVKVSSMVFPVTTVFYLLREALAQ